MVSDCCKCNTYTHMGRIVCDNCERTCSTIPAPPQPVASGEVEDAVSCLSAQLSRRNDLDHHCIQVLITTARASVKQAERLEEMRHELRAWCEAAVVSSASRSDIDVSTPDKFRASQAHAICRLFDQIDQLQSALATAEKKVGELQSEVKRLTSVAG